MDTRHAWDRLVDLTGNIARDYEAVQPYIREAIETGKKVIDNGVTTYTAVINGQTIVVTGLDLPDGIFQVSNAWIQIVAK